MIRFVYLFVLVSILLINKVNFVSNAWATRNCFILYFFSIVDANISVTYQSAYFFTIWSTNFMP